MRGSVIRRWGAAGAALALCLSLAACQGETMTAFDAADYVQGVLDETYKGTWDNAFLDLVDLTDGEAQDAYEASLEEEYRRFAYQFDLNDGLLTEETRQSALDLLAEVSVRPMDLFIQVREDALADFQAQFSEQYAGVDLESLTAEERTSLETEYENAWAGGIVELCRSRLGLVNYRDVERILVLVAPDDDGLYTMSDNDFSNLSALILPY